MGLLAFSPFSSYLLMTLLGLSFSMPEVFLIAFVIILGKRFRTCFSLDRKILLRLLTGLIILVGISFIVDKFPAYNIIGCARIYFILLLTLAFSVKKEALPLVDICYISLGAVIGWIFCARLAINMFMIGDADMIAVCGNMLSIPALVLSSHTLPFKKSYILVFMLCGLLAIMTGMRRVIVVLGISLLLYLSFTSSSIRRFIRYISIPLILTIFLIPYIGAYLEAEMPLLYYRIFDKSKSFLHGNFDESDEVRNDLLSNLLKDMELLPRGLVSRDTIHHDTGGYIDFPLTEVFYTFGFFFGILFIIYIIRIFLNAKTYAFRSQSYNAKLILSLMLVMFVLMFLEGTFLSSTYTVPYTGYILGQAFYYSKQNKLRINE